MVGETLETARPSVVVFCFYKHFEELRTLFRERLKGQMNCEPWYSDLLNRLRVDLPRRGKSRRGDQDSDNMIDLVYFCVDRCPIERKGSEDTLAAYSETAATWCGGLVKSGSVTSTLGPAIYAPDFLGVLTVDHIFHPPTTSSCNSDSQAEEDAPEAYHTSASHSDSSEQQNKPDLWLEDTDEYDFDDMTWQHNSAIAEDIGAGAMEIDSVNNYHDANGDVVLAKWQRVLPKVPLDDKAPYLDWTLVRPMLDIGARCLPNTFFPDGLDHKPVEIVGIFKESPAHWSRVFMVSGIRGIRKGHILASYSVLGPTTSYEACETWIVILDSDPGAAGRFDVAIVRVFSILRLPLIDILLEGECGSLIIDQKSSEIYGHVVGCGPLGQVYVSPMKHVLDQIKTYFEREKVQIISDQASGTSTSTELKSAREYSSYSKLDSEVVRQPQHLRQQVSSTVGTSHSNLVRLTDNMGDKQKESFTADEYAEFKQFRLDHNHHMQYIALLKGEARNEKEAQMMEKMKEEHVRE